MKQVIKKLLLLALFVAISGAGSVALTGCGAGPDQEIVVSGSGS